MHTWFVYTKLLIEKARKFNSETHLAFIEVSKVFNNVKRSLLWSIMAVSYTHLDVYKRQETAGRQQTQATCSSNIIIH